MIDLRSDTATQPTEGMRAAIAAAVVGEPMHLLKTDGGSWLAAEPHDDQPGWREITDGTVVHVTADGVVEIAL